MQFIRNLILGVAAALTVNAAAVGGDVQDVEARADYDGQRVVRYSTLTSIPPGVTNPCPTPKIERTTVKSTTTVTTKPPRQARDQFPGQVQTLGTSPMTSLISFRCDTQSTYTLTDRMIQTEYVWEE